MVSNMKPDMNNEGDLVNIIIPLIYDETTTKP